MHLLHAQLKDIMLQVSKTFQIFCTLLHFVQSFNFLMTSSIAQVSFYHQKYKGGSV